MALDMNKNTKKTKKSSVAKIIGAIVVLLLVFILLWFYIFCRQIFGDEIGDAILGAGVENGFVAIGMWAVENANAILWSLIIIGIFILLDCVLFFINNLIFRKTPRLKTIGSLNKSLIKYSSFIICLCIVLAIWGVNAAAIVAGLGIIGLIIGLACKTLVSDIVSGLFIVIDNYFEIGDKIRIDNFDGYVEAIGLRTTKIKNWQGDIKCINNSSITTVINLSKYKSFSEVTIDVSFNEDLLRVEAIISKNLDKIHKQIPEIVEGPFYKGVSALDECGVQLCFHALVHEKDRIPVNRKLLRELYLLFVNNDIIIPFRQLVVNEPDPINKPRANKSEIRLAEKIVYGDKNKNKNKNESNKNKKFNKIVSAIVEASKISGDE